MYQKNQNTSYPLASIPHMAQDRVDALKNCLLDFRFNVYADGLAGTPTMVLANIGASVDNTTLDMYFDAYVKSNIQQSSELHLSRYLAMDGTDLGNFSQSYSNASNGIASELPGGFVEPNGTFVLLSTEEGVNRGNSRAELRDSKPMLGPTEATDFLKDYASISFRFKGKVGACHPSGMATVGFYRTHAYDFSIVGSNVPEKFQSGVECLVGFISWEGKWRISVVRRQEPGVDMTIVETAFLNTNFSIFDEHELEVHVLDFGNRAEMFVDGVKVFETSGTLPNRSTVVSGVTSRDKAVFYGAAVRCAETVYDPVTQDPTTPGGTLVQMQVKAMEAKRFSQGTSQTINLGSLKISLGQDQMLTPPMRVDFDKTDFLGVTSLQPQIQHPYVVPPADHYYDGYVCMASPIQLVEAFNSVDSGLLPIAVGAPLEASTTSVFGDHRVHSIKCRNSKPLIEQTVESQYEFTSSSCVGDVKLVPGNNCSISILPATRTIVVSAQRNANGTQEEQCGIWKDKVGEKDVLCNEAIYSISGAEPDENGDVQVRTEIPLAVSSLRGQDIAELDPAFSGAVSQFPHIMRFIYVGLPKSAGNPNVLDCNRA